MLDESKEEKDNLNLETPKTEDAAELKAVAEVEEEIAKESEDKQEDATTSIDYSSLSLERLVSEFETLLNNQPVKSIKSSVDSIKAVFNAKFAKVLAEKKAAFLAEGGNSIDFQFSSPEKSKFNELLKSYKEKRDKFFGDLDKQLNQNLQTRLLVIEALKELIQNADPKTMYKEFQELKNRWNSIGSVPRSKYNDTWRNYLHHVERFYDL